MPDPARHRPRLRDQFSTFLFFPETAAAPRLSGCRFSFAARRDSSSPACVTRQIFRYCLLVGLLGAVGFACWTWFRPYDWSPDPGARCKVIATLVTPDVSFYWVEVHLKINPGMSHDLQKPVYLQTATGTKLQPADTTLAGEDGKTTTEIWFKFWLDSSQIEGPLNLHLNDGQLSIKRTSRAPELGTSDFRNFTTNQW
jgi:hypothetical protein